MVVLWYRASISMSEDVDIVMMQHIYMRKCDMLIFAVFCVLKTAVFLLHILVTGH